MIAVIAKTSATQARAALDRGKTHVTRTPSAIIQERTFAIDPNRPVEEQFDEVAEKMAKEIPLEKLDELLANK